MTTKVVDVVGLERVFPPATVALAGVDLSIEAGEHVAITGPSGAGKSTLLSLLGLLDTATAGTYRLLGREVAALSRTARTAMRRDHVGFIFQSFHLIGHLSVEENVAINLTVHGMPREPALALARDTLATVGLGHRLRARPATLSGGEQQRTAIARALASPPALLLCDEPTGNLDSVTSGEILELLLQPNPATAIVIVTHDQDVAARCHRIVHMVDGRVVER